jgi:hypothetical protein
MTAQPVSVHTSISNTISEIVTGDKVGLLASGAEIVASVQEIPIRPQQTPDKISGVETQG